ncbi:SIS domain-containing protein [Nocardia sp. NPDC058114]|uniref:SIS domain-containing protein n=1 Tax=Nocardia sp. NPDC058114 TaxID=3346346 RepID=UPI0036DF926D
MSRYSLHEVRKQTLALPSDFPDLLHAAKRDAARAITSAHRIERVIVLGSGDSLNAAVACRTAFTTAGTAEFVAMSPDEFLRFPPPNQRLPDHVLVIGVSASGANPALVQALASTRLAGCQTVAVTAEQSSPLATTAHNTVVVKTGSTLPSPGIRTYQASVVALLCLARQLFRGHHYFEGLDDVETLSDAISESIELATAMAPKLATHLCGVPVVVVAGFGPMVGTARHIAAKVTESAAVPAFGVGLDDWWHVHRFGHAAGQPLLVIATPGRGHEHAVAMMQRISARRPVITLTAVDDSATHTASMAALESVTVAGGVPEVARPLTDHVLGGPLAAELAHARNMVPFANP